MRMQMQMGGERERARGVSWVLGSGVCPAEDWMGATESRACAHTSLYAEKLRACYTRAGTGTMRRATQDKACDDGRA